MKKIFIFLFVSTLAFAHEGRFLPENDLRIPVGSKFSGGVTKQEYELAISKVEKAYSNKFLFKLQKLSFIRKWEDPMVNALAFRVGPFKQIVAYGGLARHPSMTLDSFTLVLCHELGHHIGGAPVGKKIPLMGSLTIEGQADYWATLKCMREVLAKEDNVKAISDKKIHSFIANNCEASHPEENERAICIRSALASQRVADLFVALGKKEWSVEGRDTIDTIATYSDHPNTQCRWDTMFAGALCRVDHKIDVSTEDERKGVCNDYVNSPLEPRPRCWFAPTAQFKY